MIFNNELELLPNGQFHGFMHGATTPLPTGSGDPVRQILLSFLYEPLGGRELGRLRRAIVNA